MGHAVVRGVAPVCENDTILMAMSNNPGGYSSFARRSIVLNFPQVSQPYFSLLFGRAHANTVSSVVRAKRGGADKPHDVYCTIGRPDGILYAGNGAR
jgi:hypothetical protein